jgi:protein TonB
MPSRRLLLAYVASISLHAALLGGGMLAAPAPPDVTPAMIEATLRPPPPVEPVLKDTLPEPTKPAVTEAPPVGTAWTGTPKRSVIAARRKLAEHIYYPPEAIRLGLEGDVKLLLTLAADGTIVDASVAGGSGHAILDQAALRAAFALGRLPDMGRGEIILPVSFRLRP